MQTPVVVFDVNETLSDLAPLQGRFTEVGAPGHLASVWFASVLRDGLALTCLGQLRPFAELAADNARSLLHPLVGGDAVEAAVSHVLAGFGSLGLHPDVAPGVRTLRGAGARLVTLSNGAAAVAERLLTQAGLRDQFEHVLSVEDAGIWKPARRAYHYAAQVCGVAPGELLMVAVHPWDLHGAAEAGLRTAWVNRDGRPYPRTFRAPDHVLAGCGELVGVLGDSSR